MSPGVVVLLVAVVVALAFGGYRALTDGRFRGTRALHVPVTTSGSPDDGSALAGPDRSWVSMTAWGHVRAALPDAEPGARATLVQFSSAFCAPCRATRVTLGQVAEVVPGVAHLEIDAEQHLDLVRALEILRTPTTLVLDATGAEVSRASGAPRKEAVLGVLADVVGD